MLRVLAREVSDHYLPEAFYEKLFTKAEDNPTRSVDEEKILAMSLGLGLYRAMPTFSISPLLRIYRDGIFSHISWCIATHLSCTSSFNLLVKQRLPLCCLHLFSQRPRGISRVNRRA